MNIIQDNLSLKQSQDVGLTYRFWLDQLFIGQSDSDADLIGEWKRQSGWVRHRHTWDWVLF